MAWLHLWLGLALAYPAVPCLGLVCILLPCLGLAWLVVRFSLPGWSSRLSFWLEPAHTSTAFCRAGRPPSKLCEPDAFCVAGFAQESGFPHWPKSNFEVKRGILDHCTVVEVTLFTSKCTSPKRNFWLHPSRLPAKNSFGQFSYQLGVVGQRLSRR